MDRQEWPSFRFVSQRKTQQRRKKLDGRRWTEGWGTRSELLQNRNQRQTGMGTAFRRAELLLQSHVLRTQSFLCSPLLDACRYKPPHRLVCASIHVLKSFEGVFEASWDAQTKPPFPIILVYSSSSSILISVTEKEKRKGKETGRKKKMLHKVRCYRKVK